MARLAHIISFFVLLLIAVSEAREFVVGGKDSKTFWQVPDGHRPNLDYWAESLRFVTGDVLEFNLDGKNVSVVEVTKEAYVSCDAAKPVNEVKDGQKVSLDRSGPFYFMSVDQTECKRGLKLEVVVVADHHHGEAPAPAPAPQESSGTKVGIYGGATIVALLGSFLLA